MFRLPKKAKTLETGWTHESTKSQTVEWYTPSFIFEALDCEFYLDPASPGKQLVPWIPARKHYTKKHDGLTRPWRGLVWLNPPYGKYTEKWLEKLSEHNRGIALVFARTDTKWFHNLVSKASSVVFIKGRIPFIRGDGKASSMCGSASMLISYGKQARVILKHCNLGMYFKI